MPESTNMYEIRCISQRIREYLQDLAPENIFSRDVSTKWAQIFNELDELDELSSEKTEDIVDCEVDDDIYDDIDDDW